MPPSLPAPLMKKLLLRVMDRQRRGEQPTVHQLPVNKSEFPKMLCLDFNKWIDLSRAHYKAHGGEPFEPALDAARLAVKKGTLLVPIAAPNFAEASSAPNQGRRQRLAEFMVELSENRSLALEVRVKKLAMFAAVYRTQSVDIPVLELRSHLLGRGLSAILGVPPAPTPELVMAGEIIMEPETTVHYLVEGTDRETVKEWLAQDEEVAQQIAAIREIDSHMTVDQRRHLELTNLFSEGSTS
ncbi:hypothetical protein EON82_24090, partial [bacterium]